MEHHLEPLALERDRRRSRVQVPEQEAAEEGLFDLPKSVGSNTQMASIARALQPDLAGQAAADPTALLRLSSSGGRALSRFVETEHKSLGDTGSGGATYERNGLTLTHGDLTMLSGDHFSESEIMWLWGETSDDPGQKENTQDELLYALFWQLGDKDPRFQAGGSWHGMTFSDKVKKRVEARYYELASNNAAHFANPGQAGFGVAGFPPGSAGATYHEAHERAMVEAYKAGSRGSDISPAMEREAMAEHFLTDSFAAGHLSTRRTSITEYWNDKHPNFGDQFVKKVAHDMAVKLNDQSTGISGALTIGQFEDGALSIIREKLTGKPLPKLGDILAVTVHSYDNNRGLWVTNDVGWSWAAWGDSNLDPQGADQDAPPPHTNREVATLAVHMGIEDVSIAHSMGRRDAGALLPDLQLFDQVRQQVQAPAVPGEKYGPEQLMPRIDDRIDQGELGWQVDSLQTLWETRVRSNSPTTFGEYISNDMKPGGSMGDELEALYLGIDEEMDPIGSKWYGKAAEVIIPILMVAHGHVYPRRAFKESVLDQVRDKGPCLVFLLDVVSK